MSERVAQLAQALGAEGVRALFGITGSGLSLALITALERLGVPFYATAHEGSAAIMAGAFARRSGTLGCAISIKGPGFANMLGGLLVDFYEQLPVLSVAEAFGPSVPGSRMHKRLDHEAAGRAFTKAYATLGDPRGTVAALAGIARAEIPGPVHLDLFDEAAGVLHERITPDPAADGSERVWSELRARLARSQRPVVIAGALAARRAWGAGLAGLRVPVFTTLAAKGVLDETAPFAAGVFTGDGRDLSPEARILPEADLVVGLGLRNAEVLSAKPFPCDLAIVDVVGDNAAGGFAPALFSRAAGDQPFGDVFDALSGKEWGRERVAEATTGMGLLLAGDEWLPGVLYRHLERELPAIGCLVVDTGYFCTVAEHAWRARSAASFLCSANGRSMGTALPSAIAAALADRSAPTVCVMGDGGAMYVADLRIAVAEALPVLFLLLSDGRYGSVADATSVVDASRRATTIARPSWFRAVEGLDCPAEQVKDEAAFVTALRRWDWRRGPLFLEAPFDPERYATMLKGVR
jgi:thiamine pyrophosphate-dependent acetolactate synthase large subunit-like protein